MRVEVAVVNQRIPNVVQIVNDAPFCIYAFQFVAVALRLKLNYVGPTILLEILLALLAVRNHGPQDSHIKAFGVHDQHLTAAEVQLLHFVRVLDLR